MLPATSANHADDTEFDLDVRLEAVVRHLSADPAKPSEQGCPDVTDISCISCKPPCLE